MSEIIPLDTITISTGFQTRLNIHGLPGCSMHSNNGVLCSACCHVKKVNSDIFSIDEIPDDLKVFMEEDTETGTKDINTNCKFMSSNGEGCSIHEDAPYGCLAYSCSRDSSSNKLVLLKYCLKQNYITQDEYNIRLERIINASSNNR